MKDLIEFNLHSIFWGFLSMVDYCINCGQKLNIDDIFCSNCGSEVEKGKISDSTNYQPRSVHSGREHVTQPKLYRTREDRWVAGVCGGLGRHFNIDPILIRIGFILLVIPYAAGIILYIILAIFIEEEPLNTEFAPPMKPESSY